MDYLTYIASSCAIVTLIFSLFALAERVAQEDARIKASLWLLYLELGKGFSQGAMRFAMLFDTIYGKKHFSFRCIFLSCLTSTIAVMSLSVILYLFFPELFSMIDYSNALAKLSVVIAASFFSNLIPDYLSLLESRLIILRFGILPSIQRIILMLIVDIVLTTLIFMVYFFSLIQIFSLIRGRSMSVLDALISLYSLPLFRNYVGDLGPLGIYFWSTFFTSFWIWIYLLGIGVIRFSRILGFGWKFLRDSFLNIEDKPYESMGFVTSSTVLIILLVGGGIYQVIF